ncbi:competence protein, partial [Helicobacter pylori]
IGGCVDLQGAQYAMQLYKDDSKCALQTTSDKGYGMGKTQTFQTEIVFRGMDNLIHVAVPCSDYARVQDRIVRYEKNDKTQTLTPIVDQYYNDPSNPNKQQILNRGIATQLSSQYQEFACGQWEYNDAKLEAKRPTMLKSYNKLNGEWVEVTPCNFEAGIKSGAVVSP